MGTSGTITPIVCRQNVGSHVAFAWRQMQSLKDLERSYIAEVLKYTHGRKIKAATILGISRKTLLGKAEEVRAVVSQ